MKLLHIFTSSMLAGGGEHVLFVSHNAKTRLLSQFVFVKAPLLSKLINIFSCLSFIKGNPKLCFERSFSTKRT